MAYIDNVFNTMGKIPTDSDFWAQDISNFVAGDTITSGFAQVIGEQVFRPLMSPRTPFYNKFAGRVLNSGVGWTESALYKKGVRKFKPKATAEDNFGFYDSEGVQKTFTLNVEGWIPNTIPSELASVEAFLKSGSVGTLNAQLVDLVNIAYQNAIESEIEKKAISCTKNEMSVDVATDGIVNVFGQIMDKASEMMSDDYHYNELTEEENNNLTTRSDKIYLFIEQKYLNAYKNAKASIPNPSELGKGTVSVGLGHDSRRGGNTAFVDGYVAADLAAVLQDPVIRSMSREQIEKMIAEDKRRMEKSASSLDFTQAARYRDEMWALQQYLKVWKD